ncbi:xanthine dehydrogenase family protein molybdopterin-binding subunit [Elongatibacter sediminis]|uniref:Molybdopterin cofactor-binding domain-containing protein n=1 Tax=Elongatibacter sediminis TaxID=3119006 RepID=A0AAW9RE79_9GAMM
MKLSRRKLISNAAGLGFGFSLAPLAVIGADPSHQNGDAAPPATPDAWVRIAPNGVITIQTPSDEMGQGSMTALPVILAEELDADWEDVRIEFCPPDDQVYGNPNLAGLVLTVASWAVNSYYDRMRLHGAQMRRILLDSAARQWRVAASELHTGPSRIVHAPSGRTMTYGEAAAVTELPAQPPIIREEDLKRRDQFRLIGTDLPRRDIPAKSDGSARYAIDVRLPDLVHATVIRPPVPGARVRKIKVDKESPKHGMVEVIDLADRVAIVAARYSSVQAVRDSIRVEWDGVGRFDSRDARRQRTERVRDLSASGFPWQDEGNVDTAFAAAESILEGEYGSEYVYHAQMEPLNATARFHDDGSLEVWAGTQAPSHCVRSVAGATGIDPSAVRLHRMYSGGAFGRRGAADQDYAVDAAVLAKRLGRPVKVIWSREEDIHAGRFKPMSAQYLRAALDDSGRLLAWHHRVVSEESLTQGDPYRHGVWGKIPITGILGAEQSVYDIPHRRAEHLLEPAQVRVSPMRGVGVTPNRFAAESFLDEVAQAQGEDPLELRLRLAAQRPRARAVLEAVAAMAQWHRPRAHTALGLAFTAYDATLLACVAEVSVEMPAGRIRVHRLWSAVDPGLVVQPVNAQSQIQGGLMFGLSNALKERIDIREGEVQQSNFHDYSILQASEVPEVEVRLLEGGSHPSAIGEVGVLLPAPAVANAFTRLTGKRLRHLPFSPDRVRSLLGG